MNMHPDGSGSLNGGQSDDALSNGDHHAAKGPHVTLLNQLQNKSSQSLFLVVHKILDDIIKNRKEDVPDDTVAFLKELVQIIEQQSLQQAQHLSKFKTREEKYQSKIRAFTAIVTGVMEENKAQKTMVEEKKRLEEENKILRERTQMYHEQYEKEMDFLEKFSQDPLKVFQDFMEEQKNKREKLQQGESKTVDAVPQRNENVEKDVKPQSKEIKEVEEERARLMKLHEEEMAEMKSKEMEAKEKFNSKLDQLTKRIQSLKG